VPALRDDPRRWDFRQIPLRLPPEWPRREGGASIRSSAERKLKIADKAATDARMKLYRLLASQ